jgi:K+/H+ antiporter YhaU regulatory subunit KhtT
MEDLILQLEKDPEILEMLSELSESEQESILSEMKQTSEKFQSALSILERFLVDEGSIISFVDSVGKTVGEGALSDNVGVEEIEWPEKH